MWVGGSPGVAEESVSSKTGPYCGCDGGGG